MDVASILITAVLGGIFGGVGGFVGYLVGKRFPARSQLVRTLFTCAGGAAALVLSPIVQGSFDGGHVDQELVAQYDREFRNTSSLFEIIAGGWPSEYQEFLNTLARKGSHLDQATANSLGNELTTGLRKSNADLALYSEDAGLRDYFRGYVAFLLDVNARDGEQLCAAIIARGPSALGENAVEYLAHIDNGAQSVMKVLLEGRDRRDSGAVSAPGPSDADIRAFEAFLFERTGKQGLLSRMNDGRDPDLCLIGIQVLGALGEFAPDQLGGHALRATTFRNIIAS